MLGRQATNLGLLGVDPSKKCDAMAEEFDFVWEYDRQRLNEGPAERIIAYAPEAKQDRSHALMYKVKTTDQRKEDFHLIKHVNFLYLCWPVAMAGLAACWMFAHKASMYTDERVWHGLGYVAAGVLAFVLGLLVAKVSPEKTGTEKGRGYGRGGGCAGWEHIGEILNGVALSLGTSCTMFLIVNGGFGLVIVLPLPQALLARLRQYLSCQLHWGGAAGHGHLRHLAAGGGRQRVGSRWR